MKKTSTVNDVKAKNTDIILDLLKEVPCATKPEIASASGLSLGTCNKIINELLENKRILPETVDYQMSGRPPQGYRFNEDFYHICCLYMTYEDNKKAIHISSVDLLGKVLISRHKEVALLSPETICEAIAEECESDPLIRCISMGIGGYEIDGNMFSTAFAEMDGCPLRKIVEERFGLETHLHNDLNTITLGLYEKLCPGSPDPFAALAFFKGKCPGAGAVINGKILRGFSNYAGEINDMIPNDKAFWDDISSHYRQAKIFIANYTSAYITLINPRNIVLLGMNASGHMVQDVAQICEDHILPSNMPKIQYIDDFWSYYIYGLYKIAA